MARSWLKACALCLHLAAGGGKELGAVSEHQGGYTGREDGTQEAKLPISVGSSERGAARSPQSSTHCLLGRTGMSP